MGSIIRKKPPILSCWPGKVLRLHDIAEKECDSTVAAWLDEAWITARNSMASENQMAYRMQIMPNLVHRIRQAHARSRICVRQRLAVDQFIRQNRDVRWTREARQRLGLEAQERLPDFEYLRYCYKVPGSVIMSVTAAQEKQQTGVEDCTGFCFQALANAAGPDAWMAAVTHFVGPSGGNRRETIKKFGRNFYSLSGCSVIAQTYTSTGTSATQTHRRISRNGVVTMSRTTNSSQVYQFTATYCVYLHYLIPFVDVSVPPTHNPWVRHEG